MMKALSKALTVVFLLFEGLIMTVILCEVGLGEQSQSASRMNQGSPPACNTLEAFGRRNLCQEAAIRDNEQPEFSRSEQSDLMAVIDGDPLTHLTRSCTNSQWLEIRFPGARRWLNTVEIQFAGRDSFEFEVLDSKGGRERIEVISTELEPGPGSSKIMTIELMPVQAKGIRWSWAVESGPDEGIDIYEISARFIQDDPDKQSDQDLNDTENWLLCENVSGMGTDDMRPLWNKITALSDWCPSSWHYCHWWKGQAAWDGDFTRAGAGGYENSHSSAWTGMDYHDLSVVALHGSPCKIHFPNTSHIDGVLTAPGDVSGSWGNGDAEWFCALSCSPYEWPNCPWSWAQAFDGLHLQCGFTTTAYATSGAFLGGFANNMISTNWFDPALPIALSWFLAKNAFMIPVSPTPVCAIVLADEWMAYYDHLWGQGWVSPDPSPPGGIVWAIWDPPFTERESRNRTYPPPMTEQQWRSVQKITSGPSSRLILATGSRGIAVKTTQDIFRMYLPDSMTVYNLIPLSINSTFVEDLTDDLCANYGFFCAPEVGQDEDGNWWATEDEYALWGDPENGIIQFVNVDEYCAKMSAAPAIPGTSTAHFESDNLLSNLDLYPSGQASVGYSYNIQTAYDLDLEEIVSDSSFDLSVNVDYYRVVNGYPVYGPGGYIAVTWGEGLTLQHFTRGGWHDLVNPNVESVISVEEAIDLLTTMGEDATIGGIPPIADTFLVDSVGAAYYNTNGEYETDILEPIYHFSCYAASEFDTIPCDIFVPARSSLLRGSILEPPDGSSYPYGSEVTFAGSATGGSPTYTFDWSSDVDGYLGNGQTIALSTLSVNRKDSFLLPHTITLTVTDTEAISRKVSISVTIETCCVIRGDINHDDTGPDIADLVYLVTYMFQFGPEPPCMEEADVNGDGNGPDIADLVYLVTYMFQFGPAPVPCP